MTSPYVGTISASHAETARRARAREIAEQRYEREQGPRPEPVAPALAPSPRRPLRVIFEGARKPTTQTPATTSPPSPSRAAAPSPPPPPAPGGGGEVVPPPGQVVLTQREWQAVARLIDAQPDPKPLRVVRGQRSHRGTSERY